LLPNLTHLMARRSSDITHAPVSDDADGTQAARLAYLSDGLRHRAGTAVLHHHIAWGQVLKLIQQRQRRGGAASTNSVRAPSREIWMALVACRPAGMPLQLGMG
jgi:hypothetical protein